MVKRSVLFHLPKPSNLFCSSGSQCALCPHRLKAWQCCNGHYTVLTRKATFKNQFRSPHFLIRVSQQKHNIPLLHTLVFAGTCTGTHVAKKILQVFPSAFQLSFQQLLSFSDPLGSGKRSWGEPVEPALVFLLPLSVRSWIWLVLNKTRYSSVCTTALFIYLSIYLFTYLYIYLIGVVDSLGWQTLPCQGEKGLHTCKVKEWCWANQNWQVLGTQTPFGTFSSNKINFKTPWDIITF